MKWYVVDLDYINYLRRIDEKVQEIEYGGRFKPYFGIVFKISNHNYYIPVSSPKPKHRNMRNNKDFHKIVDPDNGQLLSIININNMIPVPDECIQRLYYTKIDQYRIFNNSADKVNYINLLRKELGQIHKDKDVIKANAEYLYLYADSNPNNSLSLRCCQFKLLENAVSEYNSFNKR